MPLFNINSRTPLLLAGFLVFCVIYIWKICSVGLTFPVPWPDEANFLWQAIAFQEHNHLFAPQLHSSRDLMWMPPGYALVMGTLFKLTGFTLEIARWTSAVLVMVSLGVLVLACSKHKAAFWILLLAGISLLSSRFVLAGNFARMDALLMFLVISGMVAIARHQWYPGLALLALSPLVHPNGLHFCMIAGLYTLWHIARRDQSLIPQRKDLLWITAVLVAWLAYIIYVAMHWENFVSDMQFQVQFKNAVWAAGGLVGTLRQPHIFLPLLVVIPGFLFAGSTVVRTLLLLLLSLVSLNLISKGLMYGVFEALAVLLTNALAIVLWVTYAQSKNIKSPITHLLSGLIVALLVGLEVHWRYLERRPLAPEALEFGGLQAQPNLQWLGDTERQIITDYLRNLKPEQDERLNVLFLPAGDSLLFEEEEGDHLRFMSYTVEVPRVDVIISHESPTIPELVRAFAVYLAVEVAGGAEFLDQEEELYSDDQGNRWRVWDLRKRRNQE